MTRVPDSKRSLASHIPIVQSAFRSFNSLVIAPELHRIARELPGGRDRHLERHSNEIWILINAYDGTRRKPGKIVIFGKGPIDAVLAAEGRDLRIEHEVARYVTLGDRGPEQGNVDAGRMEYLGGRAL